MIQLYDDNVNQWNDHEMYLKWKMSVTLLDNKVYSNSI